MKEDARPGGPAEQIYRSLREEVAKLRLRVENAERRADRTDAEVAALRAACSHEYAVGYLDGVTRRLRPQRARLTLVRGQAEASGPQRLI